MMHVSLNKPSIDKRIGGLDELRGVAIIAVMIHHMWWAIGSYQLGGPAVDLFFIISGFLIGKILLNSQDEKNYYSIFYAKRISRIFPLAIVMLFLGIILAVFLGWNLDSLPYYFLFIQNYIPSQTVIGTHQDWTGHLPGINTMWSLAVEEHFYFVAPFLILKLRGVGLPITLFFLSIGSVYLKINYINSHPSYTLFSNPLPTECRVVYLAAGVIINLKKWRYLYIFIVSAFWIACQLLVESDYGKLDVISFVLLWIIVVGTINMSVPIRCRFLGWIGIRCYGIYLLHMPITLILKKLDGKMHPSIMMVILFLTSFILAEISLRFFEKPANRKLNMFFMKFIKP